MNHASQKEIKRIFLFWLVGSLAFLKVAQQGFTQSSRLTAQVEQHYSKGSELMQRGELQAAEQELKQVTTLAPQIPEPYYLLAKISIARGSLDQGESLLLRALQLKPDFAEAQQTLGGIYLQRNDYVRARSAFEHTLRLKPGYAVAHVNLGLAFIGLKQSTQAIAELKTAIELAPQASATLFRACYQLGALYYGQGDYRSAISPFERARPLNPTHPELLLSLADIYLKLNRLAEATSVLKEVERIASATPALRAPLGLLLAQNGRYEEAAQQLETAQKSTASFEVFYGLGTVYIELKRYSEAVTAFSEALRIQPNHARTHFLKGQAHAAQGDPRAVESLRRAVVLDPSQDPAWEALAEQLFRARASPEVLSLFQGYAERFPQKPMAHLLLGEAWVHRQRLTEALAEFKQAVALDSTLARAHVSVGFVYMELGQQENARQSFQEALRADPDQVLASFYMADLLSHAEDIEPALELLNRTIELKPEYVDAYFERGKLYLRQSQFQKAVADLLKVIALKPDRAQAYYVLGRAYQGWGKRDEANQAYQRFAELKEKLSGSLKKVD